jgi:hypothetical protein
MLSSRHCGVVAGFLLHGLKDLPNKDLTSAASTASVAARVQGQRPGPVQRVMALPLRPRPALDLRPSLINLRHCFCPIPV